MLEHISTLLQRSKYYSLTQTKCMELTKRLMLVDVQKSSFRSRSSGELVSGFRYTFKNDKNEFETYWNHSDIHAKDLITSTLDYDPKLTKIYKFESRVFGNEVNWKLFPRPQNES